MCQECSTCPAGTWASNTCGGHEDSVCEPCARGRCQPGQWLTDLTNCDTDAMTGADGMTGSQGAVTFCVACSTCPSGQYKSENCDFDRDTQCEHCTLSCGAGEYLDGECTQRGEDATTTATRPVCRPCPPRHYWSGDITGGFDAQCPQCVLVEDCTATGWYLSGECTADSTGACRRCESCPAGTYVQYPCGGRQQTGCRVCPRGMFTNQSDAVACRPHTVTSCPNGRFAVSPSSTADGRCRNTNLPTVAPTSAPSSFPSMAPSVAVGCPPGQRLLQTPSPSEHAACTACAYGKFQPTAEFLGLECAWWTACGAGAYGVNGSAMDNVECVACQAGSYQPLTDAWVPVESCIEISAPCGTGYFMSEPASPSADRVCSVCSTCSVDTGEYMISSCSETVDTRCEVITRCPRLSAQGHPVYELAPATGSSNTVCAPVSDCGVNEFEFASPTGRSDRVCRPCRECSFGFTEVSQCTATSDRACASRCEPGTFLVSYSAMGSGSGSGPTSSPTNAAAAALSCAQCDGVWTTQPALSCGKPQPCSFSDSLWIADLGVAT